MPEITYFAMQEHVRFGSKADICTAPAHVRFTLNSDRESGPPQRSCLLYPSKQTVRCNGAGPLRANSGHRASPVKVTFWKSHLVGIPIQQGH